MTDGRGRKIATLIDGLDGALKAAEERFGADQCGLEVDCVGEFIYYKCQISKCKLKTRYPTRLFLGRLTIFEHLVKVLEMVHDNVPMLLQYSESDEEMEIATEPVCP